MAAGRHITLRENSKNRPWLFSEPELRQKLYGRLDIKPALSPACSAHYDPQDPQLPRWCEGEEHIPWKQPQTNFPSDYDLNPGMRSGQNPNQPLQTAAVLIAIRFDPEPMVLFTQRTTHLANHPGQISFPGGKIDKKDKDATAAALREAHEELGIDERYVEPIGFLERYETRTGFLIAPLIAILKPGFTLSANPHEVAECFDVPLEYLMDPNNHKIECVKLNGIMRYYYALPFETRYIWGATAGILVNMHKRLFT